MRVFVTGASGWIGSAVVPELLAAGHRVLGLARSAASAKALAAAGAAVHRGDLNDPKSLQAGASECEGVIHLGFIHEVVGEHYLGAHANPGSVEYYLCGPPMMIRVKIIPGTIK